MEIFFGNGFSKKHFLTFTFRRLVDMIFHQEQSDLVLLHSCWHWLLEWSLILAEGEVVKHQWWEAQERQKMENLLMREN